MGGCVGNSPYYTNVGVVYYSGATSTSGAGFAALANRPTSCTPQVGYFATDQGNWNQRGNGFAQGELFVCTATHTWTMRYEPFTYPHPLTTGGTTTSGEFPAAHGPRRFRSVTLFTANGVLQRPDGRAHGRLLLRSL
jgi:hypothetical protein